MRLLVLLLVGLGGWARAASPQVPTWVVRASLNGVVLAKAGSLVPGAEVTAELVLAERYVVAGTAKTDASGRYRLDGIVPGRYRVSVRHPRYRTHWFRHWVESGRNRAPPQQLGAGVQLAGRVVDADSVPVSGARVHVDGSSVAGTGPDSTTSAADGTFLLSGLGSGVHDVHVTASGFVPRVQRGVATPATAALTIRLQRLARLVGSVRGPARAGARVLVARGGRLVARHEADATGRFELADLPPGTYEVMAHSKAAPWRASVIGTVRLPGAEIELVLQPASRVVGHVVQSRARSQEPVSGATVVLRVNAATLVGFVAQTDKTGWFELPPVVAGGYRLQAWAAGLLPVAGVAVQVPRKSPLVVKLVAGVAVVGRVVDESGAPVSAAIVRATAAGLAAVGSRVGELGVVPGPVPPIPQVDGPVLGAGLTATGLWSAATDSRGNFRLSGLPPAGFGLAVSHPDFRSLSLERVSLVAHPPSDLGTKRSEVAPPGQILSVGSIVLRAGTRIAGRVLDERGFALAGVRVVLTSAQLSRRARTDQRGEFSFAGVAGRVELSAYHDGYQPSREVVQVPPAGRHELEVVLREAVGEIRGTVVDERGLSLSGALVHVVSSAPGGGTRTGSDGAFVLRSIGDGVVTLRVERSGYATRERGARAGSALLIALQQHGTLRGRVVERRTGAAVARFELRLDDQRAHLVRDPLGRFEISAAPGVHRLRAHASGFARGVQEIVVPDPARVAHGPLVVLELSSAGFVSGVVHDRGGKPAAAIEVSCAGVEATTDAQGRFRLDDVPEGEHELRVASADGRHARQTVVVRSDTDGGPLQLRLGPAAVEAQ